MVRIHYSAQLASIAGVHDEQIEIEENSPLAHLLQMLAERHGERFSRFFFDSQGRANRSAIVSVNEEQVLDYKEFLMKSHHREILILTPMSGG